MQRQDLIKNLEDLLAKIKETELKVIEPDLPGVDLSSPLEYSYITSQEEKIQFEKIDKKDPKYLLQKIYSADLSDIIVQKVIENKKDVLDWKKISRKEMSKEFIIKFIKYIDMVELSKNGLIKENGYQLIKDLQDHIDMSVLCKHVHVCQEFIDEFADVIDWKQLVQNETFSETFIEKYSSKIDWSLLKDRKLSPKFIRKYFDKLELSPEKIEEIFINDIFVPGLYDVDIAKTQFLKRDKTDLKGSESFLHDNGGLTFQDLNRMNPLTTGKIPGVEIYKGPVKSGPYVPHIEHANPLKLSEPNIQQSRYKAPNYTPMVKRSFTSDFCMGT